MTIKLFRAEDARSWLQDGASGQQWDLLFQRCPWASPFQSRAFAATWYSIYAERYEPLIVTQVATDGELIGLLLLAIEKKNNALVGAGTHHAEYQVWLSRSEAGNEFILAALGHLQLAFPTAELYFKYLPPDTPLKWIKSDRLRGSHLDLQPYRRPLLRIRDGRAIAESLKKKSNKSRLNRLKQVGDLRFEQITDPSLFAAMFDEIIAYTDLRQGAVHDILPFRIDALKKPFHLALMQHPELVHVTVMKVGEVLVSAHFGICSSDEVTLWLFAHSPFQALHSPGKFHLLLLGEMLATQGIKTFDLTPGGDPWKERFATDHDHVHTLRVVFDSGSSQIKKRKAQQRLESLAKRGFQFIGIAPHQVRSLIGKLRRVSPVSIPKKLLRKVWEKTEFRVYVYDPEDVKKLPHPQLMSRDDLSALIAFSPMADYQTQQGFFERALQQLESEQHCYSLTENDCLVHYGWLGLRQQKAKLSEVGQEYIFDEPENAVLYDFFTHPQARGRGLYQQALYQILHDVAELPDIKRIYIMVLADNAPSRHVIEKVGFTYESSLFRQKRLGKTITWSTKSL
ncbi:MAG: GNAT family N-acetyltransferase [Acidobacteria bacterium]|nr:GNAT family N-acetyltransferase [Acidobacteriota bacterium]